MRVKSIIFLLALSGLFCPAAFAQFLVWDSVIHAYKDGADIVFEWRDVQLADGYNIYRFESIAAGPPYPLYATVLTPGFRDPGAVNGPPDTLFYVITAFNTTIEEEAPNWAYRIVVTLEMLPSTLNNHHVALPYFYFPEGVNDPDGLTAEDVCIDAGADLAYVGMWRSDVDVWQAHFCGSPLMDFEIAAGRACLLAPHQTFAFSIVGSHDPYFKPGSVNTVGLYCLPGTGCNNWVSVPYSSVASTAQELCDELISRGHDIRTMNKWLPDQDMYFVKTCGSFRDFDFTPGIGVMIQPGREEQIQIEVH
ncbi:hypothetical protein ACFLU6_05610 [Acidobacteriota bacterium]